MKSSQPDRFEAVIRSTTSPSIKAALERARVYAQQTNGRFIADLHRAKAMPHAEGAGVLAGPVKKPLVVKPLKKVAIKTFKVAKKAK